MNASESGAPSAQAFPEWERVDTGPLSWVMAQLRESLDKSLEALRTFANNREDGTALKLAKSNLHQAHGALQIVNLEGVALLTEEVENLFESFETDAYACSSEAIEAVAAAYRAVIEYLEELLSGAPHQPVRLFPSYRVLLGLRGADRIHPADLFYPDLSIRPPRRADEAAGQLSASEVAAQRARFERALLQFLRDEKNREAAKEMCAAVTAIEAVPKQGQQRAFWWVTRAFFDALSADAVPTDLNVKRLCARINLQIRRLLDGSGTVAERLLRDTLFFVARSQNATPHVAEVKRVYGLENSLPDDFETERFGRIDLAALRSAKEALASAKTAWGLVVAGDQGQIAGFAQDSSTLLAAAGSLGRPGLAHVAQVVASIGTELSFDPRRPAESVGLDVATALLFLEGAIDQVRSLDASFDERAEAVVARVESSALGQPVESGDMAWLDEMTRQAQERLTMASFVNEMQANLRTAEKTLDAFFRDPTQRADLPAAEKLMGQIGGALSVLGHDQASQAIEAARAQILRFAEASYEPNTQEFERLAQSLGAVGFYVESLQHRSDVGTVFRFDAATGTFVADLARVTDKSAAGEPDPDPEPQGPGGKGAPSGPENSTHEATVEDEIARHGDLVARLAAAVRADFGDTAAREELTQALHRVQQDALLIDDSSLTKRAGRALKALRDTTEDHAEDLTATMFQLTEDATRFTEERDMTATMPLPKVTAPVPESASSIDAELLEIFLAEAAEVLETAQNGIAEIATKPADRECMTVVRRCFHTLKGSGRMVGLNAFGEASWAIEQTLNAWLSEARPASPELLGLLRHAVEELGYWVNDLTSHGSSSRTPDGLIAAAERLRDGHASDEAAVRATPVRPPAPTLAAPVIAGLDAPSGVAMMEPEWTSTEVMPDPAAEVQKASEIGESLDEEDLIIDIFAPAQAPAEAKAPAAPVVATPPPMAAAPAPVDEPLGMNPDTVDFDLGESANEPVVAHTQPIEAPVATVLPFAPPAPVRTEEFKQIGHLTLSVPLFNIYLAEADELLRTLATDFGEWRHETSRLASTVAMRAAHSLAGSSATVGLTVVHDLAHALEAVLQTMAKESAVVGLEEINLLEEGVEGLRAMLHRFAAEIFPDPQPALERRLLALRDALRTDMTQSFVGSAPAQDVEAPVEQSADLAQLLTLDEPPMHEVETEPAPQPVLEPVAQIPVELAHSLDHDAVHDAAAEVVPVSEDDFNQAFATVEEIAAFDVAPLQTAPSEAASIEAVAAEAEPIEEIVAQPLEEIAAQAVEAIAPEPAFVPAVDAAVEPTVEPAFEPAFEHTGEITPLPGAEFVDPPITQAVAEFTPVVELTPPPEPEPYTQPVYAAVQSPAAFADREAVEAAKAAARAADNAAEAAVAAAAISMAMRPPSQVRDEIDAELIGLFLQEASEYLPQIGENLRRWQNAPQDMSIAQALMRHMHTVKGSARMAGAMRLGEIVHDMETRVESAVSLREIPRHAFEELFAQHDRSVEMFDQLSHRDETPAVVDPSTLPTDDPNYRGVERRARNLIEAEVERVQTGVGTAQAFAGLGAQAPTAPVVQAVRVRADLLDRLVNQAGEVSISRSRLENEVSQIKTSLVDLTENLQRLRGQLREVEIQAETQMQSQLSLSKEKERFDPLEFDRFTRLQELTRMMAESVNDVATVHQNLLKSLDGANRDLSAQQRMTRDLQQDLMRVRMVPFSSVSERLYRVVRQTAKELDKRVNLDIRGAGVEIDRSVLERMVAPFEHLLRNAIVHGIEMPDARRGSQKSETGELLIEVRQEGNEIVIVFSDDGAGLNLRRIRERAREAGLIGQEEEIIDARAADLIFQAGFSTVAQVTELAGRGVGMDVVRAEAGGLGGRVAVDTEEARGTRFTINLPLTLAVTQVVLVDVGGRTYALPSVLVEQVQQLRPQPLAQAYNDGQILWLGQPVHLHFLAALLGEHDRSPIAQRYSPVLVLRSGGERIAIHVDEVIGNQEVVVKNVGPQLARMSGVAGATVLGSGAIVLILNPVQLAQKIERERALTPVIEHAEIGGAVAELIEQPPRAEVVTGLETLPTVMVVDDSLTVRRVTQRLLTREGYQVVLAKDGVDALQQLQDYTPDVMLVDIEMPRMDGYDLTRNVRGDERYHGIPIIMITSRTADKHRNLAMELGVNVYLGKPYQEQELLTHLKHFVGQRKRASA